MKKTLSVILAVIMLVSVTACGNDAGKSSSVGTATVVVASDPVKEYEISLDGLDETKGLFALLDKEEIPYKESGGFISEVGDLKPAEGEYIYLYTSNEKDFDVSEYKVEMEYNGTKLVSSGVGAKDMTITDGTVIYIGTITF